MKEYNYKINGRSYKVVIGNIENNVADVEVNSTHYRVEMEEQPKAAPKPVVTPRPAAPATPVAQPARSTASTAGKSGVKSPLPGVILDIKVKVGDTVSKGQTVIILEAMKMENNINADKDGIVTAINVNKGDSVLEGNDLIIIE
ncbi:biotin carboxyl carrier protein [gut metagenome]|uniref:Biotin carboxyl carrier protein of acetyl-CoA carboxylase n=1 Tax=gut metagenome TaxID=749906 RepID=J9G030_9ZZZZ